MLTKSQIKNGVILVIASIFLASCSSVYEPDAVGVGTDPNEMKISPCACLKIETKPGLPEWFTSLRS